ncbi:Histone-lysine N-methyltransferase SUVR4/SUVR1/SUVR [Trema orientale]|uniref:Histone-lysine N-methyltransferase SUVR4/SUVR1/SUVR n=1 Tax=Trema orientale TaxID=63057 RepID=A0A2P5FYR5_TREOI|nr:Histone-lysine N-methyltransferase SUVR4/SUVR1/SUVR [Trema orientale]
MVDKSVTKALSVTRGLGIGDQEVIPILEDLLTVYGNDWTLIEEDNYRTLVDAYFEHNENKGVEHKSMGSGRPAKRLHLAGKQERAFPKMNHSSGKSTSQESRTPLTSSRLQIIKASKPSASDSRFESSSRLSHAQPNNKVDSSTSSGVAAGAGDRKSQFLRSSPAVKSFDGPFGEPSCSHVTRENVPSKLQKNRLPKPSTEKRINDLPLSPKPITMIRPEPQKPPPRIDHSDRPIIQDEKKRVNFLKDITKGTEKVKISLIDEIGNETLPKFNYIPQNIIYQNANINISLARIVDEDCCSSCSGDCLSSSIPCACARETGGEFAYTAQGLLKEEFLRACISMKVEPKEDHFVYCKDCPLERSRNDDNSERCKGHLLRKFIKECWRKCGCGMQCGNRVVQRGIVCKLQVFLTHEGKGWGLRPLEDLPKGTFVCEYIGEVLTNMELYNRNMGSGKERHTYPVTLDADWGSEGFLKDEEALCLDATFHGNVARFINHRCSDSNLVDIPVEVETPDRHYYHLAFFTTRKVAALEELTWDYGIDFNDINHPIKAFHCRCGSANCRDNTRKRK